MRFWYLLGCQASKGPQWELLQYQKNVTEDNVLCKNWYMYLLGEKKISSHAHETGSWYLSLRGSFQNFCLFNEGVPPPGAYTDISLFTLP